MIMARHTNNPIGRAVRLCRTIPNPHDRQVAAETLADFFLQTHVVGPKGQSFDYERFVKAAAPEAPAEAHAV